MPESTLEIARLRCASGAELHVRRWTRGDPRSVLLVAHGLAEHSGRYAHVGESFAARGHVVIVPDLRGHGLSPGARVHVGDFGVWLEDLRAMRLYARERHPGLPLVLLGHSQGGLLALLSALREPSDLAGLALASPLLGLPPRSEPRGLLALAVAVLMRAAPALRLPNRVDPSKLSHDPAVAAAYAADPLVSHRLSAGWLHALRRALTEAHARAGELAPPTLLLVAEDDAIVDPGATRAWLARAPPGRVEASFFAGMYHELFNELGNERVFSVLAAWLEGLARTRSA